MSYEYFYVLMSGMSYIPGTTTAAVRITAPVVLPLLLYCPACGVIDHKQHQRARRRRSQFVSARWVPLRRFQAKIES